MIDTIQWILSGGGSFVCSRCNELKFDGHAPDCKLDLALRQAGVRP